MAELRTVRIDYEGMGDRYFNRQQRVMEHLRDSIPTIEYDPTQIGPNGQGSIFGEGATYYNNGNDYRRNAYASRGNPRAAVERCVNAARNDARRYGYRHAQVTEIRDVDDTRYGWKVKGRMVVDGSYAGGRYDRYGYRDRNNRYQRWNDRDSGNFTCRIERGRVADLDFSGIRGLR